MTEQRKKDHIALTDSSRPEYQLSLGEYYYEPMLGHHKNIDEDLVTNFIGHELKMPLWVSSMTGGTALAKTINTNLAMACEEFGMGMGLGSCRSLLTDSKRFDDFNVKSLMPNYPLFTNFGIAQLEELVDSSSVHLVNDITKSLQADGVIIHVNPLQEWAQPEGDRLKRAPIDTIKAVLNQIDFPVVVKEVGQGFGPQSLQELIKLPLGAIELAGFGGTNFTILEHARLSGAKSGKYAMHETFGNIGHTVDEMIVWLNQMQLPSGNNPDIIISGGISDPLRGHLLRKELKLNSVFGMASSFLTHAKDDYSQLSQYVKNVKECLLLADSFIK